MGIFDLIETVNATRHATKTMKILADKLGVHSYLLPEWVQDTIIKIVKLNIRSGITAEKAADIVLETFGERIKKDLENK